MNIKLLNDDVALAFINTRTATESLIYVEESDDDVVKIFKVVAIADRVTDVEVGDTVLAPWPRVTNIIKAPIDGVETDVVITSIKEVLGVVESE